MPMPPSGAIDSRAWLLGKPIASSAARVPTTASSGSPAVESRGQRNQYEQRQHRDNREQSQRLQPVAGAVAKLGDECRSDL